MVGKIFGPGAGTASRDEFRQGLASLKPKLSGEELEGVMQGLGLGRDSANLVNLERFIELCFPSTTEHRPLQKMLKKHFDSDVRMLKNFLLLTTSQTLPLALLLTRDGGTRVSYTEISRIAK